MLKTRNLKALRLFFSMVLPLRLVVACEKKDNPPPSNVVPITADYPADYFVVLPEPPKPPEPVIQTVYVQKEIEKKAEKLAEEKAQKRINGGKPLFKPVKPNAVRKSEKKRRKNRTFGNTSNSGRN